MRRLLPAVILALGLVLAAPGAAYAAAAVPAHHHSSVASTPPQPGQGWLTGRRQQLLGVWLLVDVGLLIGLYGSGPVRSPRLLGSVGAHRGRTGSEEDEAEAPPVEVRGIGRFARVRTGPPHRI